MARFATAARQVRPRILPFTVCAPAPASWAQACTLQHLELKLAPLWGRLRVGLRRSLGRLEAVVPIWEPTLGRFWGSILGSTLGVARQTKEAADKPMPKLGEPGFIPPNPPSCAVEWADTMMDLSECSAWLCEATKDCAFRQGWTGRAWDGVAPDAAFRGVGTCCCADFSDPPSARFSFSPLATLIRVLSWAWRWGSSGRLQFGGRSGGSPGTRRKSGAGLASNLWVRNDRASPASALL